MSNVLVDKNKIDILANAISNKSGEPLTLTIDEMVEAVDGIDTGGITPTGNIDITSAGVTDVTNYATATVPSASFKSAVDYGFYTENNTRKWHARGYTNLDVGDGDTEGWITEGAYYGNYTKFNAVASGTTITPSTSSQTVGGSGYMMEGAVTVSAMPSGTAGTPTATKGAVSNHSVSVTPSVTNTTGYITGSTKTGTAVTVSASELVSGTYSVTSSGTKDVTNYASASVPSGSVTAPTSISGSSASVSTSTNTLTLSKTVSVTPNVTTAGYVSSGTAGNSNVSLTASVTTQGAQTLHPSTTDQTITGSKYLTGTQTFKAVTTSNLTANNIKSGVTVKIGDSTDDDCVASVTGTYSGGGGGTIVSKTITTNGTYNASDDNADGYSPVTVNIPSSSWTLIKYDTLTVNTTSTTAAEAGTIACGSSAWTANDVIWVHIRGQSGKRAGYFYGTDAMFVNYRAKNSSTSACSTPAIQVIRVGSNGSYTVATGQYGVFAYSIESNGTITINKRYQSTNTLTINDTFDIYVYKLALPSGLTLFD